jgi:hypothetical protein
MAKKKTKLNVQREVCKMEQLSEHIDKVSELLNSQWFYNNFTPRAKMRILKSLNGCEIHEMPDALTEMKNYLKEQYDARV